MGQPVKISDAEMQAVREAAELHSRSIAAQAEHWIRIGRAVERDPRFGIVQIEEALRGLRSVDTLPGDQQEAFLDRLAEQLHEPSPAQHAFWADRQRRGLGVGLDAAGNIVKPARRRTA